MITITRHHDISAGHRVAGHESKCAHLHGHNYRVHFTCRANRLDVLGRVIDFSVVKEKLCNWLEMHWDHKFLYWSEDPIMLAVDLGIRNLGLKVVNKMDMLLAEGSFAVLPFNPTAENMAGYLLDIIGPRQLQGTGVELISVTIDETRKCSATVSTQPYLKETPNR